MNNQQFIADKLDDLFLWKYIGDKGLHSIKIDVYNRMMERRDNNKTVPYSSYMDIFNA